MIEAIQTRILDILQADKRLYQGGAAYEPGWEGVTRPDADLPAQPGWVNLFDESYEPNSVMNRPAIYLGTRAMDADDRLDLVTCNGTRQEMRVCTIPLVIAVTMQGSQRAAAKRQRNQLRANVKQILFDHATDALWWYMDAPGQQGGSYALDKSSVSSTGGPNGAADAICIVAVRAHYRYNATSPA